MFQTGEFSSHGFERGPAKPAQNIGGTTSAMRSRFMINALFNDSNQLALRQMLDGTVLRHEAIASNLANVETPGYKRLDLAPSFEAELKSALQAGNDAQINSLKPTLEIDRTASASGLDGNTVNLEDELLKMSQNTLSHSFQVKMISDSFEDLRTAITGRVNG